MFVIQCIDRSNEMYVEVGTLLIVHFGVGGCNRSICIVGNKPFYTIREYCIVLFCIASHM